MDGSVYKFWKNCMMSSVMFSSRERDNEFPSDVIKIELVR